MSIGFPRSVLSGAARHGSPVVRNAIQRRRGVDDGEYQWNYQPTPARPGGLGQSGPMPSNRYTPPASKPTPAPATTPYSTGGYAVGGGMSERPRPSIDMDTYLAGTGGPGGYTDKKGNFVAYGYGQDDGPYSGFNTQGGLQSAIEGDTESWLGGLARQADAITGEDKAIDSWDGGFQMNDATGDSYYAAMARLGDQSSKGRVDAWKAAEQAMPTYGELSPEVYQTALGNAGPVSPEWFAKQRVGQGTSPLQTIYQGGPSVLGASPARAGRGAIAPSNSLPPLNRSADGSTSVPKDKDGNPLIMDNPGSPAISALGPNTIETPSGATYNPAADWEAAMGGQADQFGAIDEWASTNRAAEQARFQPALDDIAAMASMPDKDFYQTVATQGYGVDPSVAAGWYSDEWQNDRDLAAMQDDVAMRGVTRELDSWETAGAPYSETQPGSVLAQERAARDLELFRQTGMTPSEYAAAQRRAEQQSGDEDYAYLDEVMGGDSRASLAKYDLTLDQVDSVLFDEQGNLNANFEDAWNALNAAFTEGDGLDEEAARTVMQTAWSIDPLLARILEAFRPELAGTDYLIP